MLSTDMVTAQSAIEAERVRNTVLASISHDFRTPLASILGSATSLLEYSDKIDDSARRSLLGDIKEEVEHLDGMVRNLLSMTRIDAGALDLRKDWIDLHEIVARVINAARRRGATQTFESRLPENLPLIQADALLVEQALTNVVGNAVKYSPDTATITFNATIAPESIQLSVEDSGTGIAPDILPHVFDKFVSVRSEFDTSANKGEGTGLGLAITKGIMTAHGGSAEAQSPIASGHGTRITFTFPHTDHL